MTETLDYIQTILDHVEEMIQNNKAAALISEIKLARRMISSLDPYFARDAIRVIFEGGEEGC